MAGKSIGLELRVWYDPKSGHIKLAGGGLTASTVSNDPASKRYHPNLFKKLAKCLREAGVPAPAEGPDPQDFEFDPPKLDLVLRRRTFPEADRDARARETRREEVKKRFGARMRQLRKARKMSQEKVALKSGLDRSYLGQIDPSTGASRLRSMLLRMSGEGESNPSAGSGQAWPSSTSTASPRRCPSTGASRRCSMLAQDERVEAGELFCA